MSGKPSRRIIARTFVAQLLAEPKRFNHFIKVLAAYLVEQNQTDQVELLLQDIAHEYFAQTGELLVDVASARPLTEAMRAEIKHALHEATAAKQIVLTEHIDQDLIGGVVARTPDAVLDTSVSAQLKQLAAIK